MLTWDEIEIERDHEDGCGCGFVRRHASDRDYEVMNGATARQDVARDRSGAGWDDFTMEKPKRHGDRSARP